MLIKEKIAAKMNFKNLLTNYSGEPSRLNSIVVTEFSKENSIIPVHGILAQYYHPELVENSLCKISTVEDVITIFEQAIPESEKTTNGAIYTPSYIRNFIVKECFRAHDKRGRFIPTVNTIADLSCGCGAFLYTVAEYLFQNEEFSYRDVLKSIYGVDISTLSIERTKIVLALAAALHNEFVSDDDLNIICQDALTLSLCQFPVVLKQGGFDMVVGNPPYVRAKHINKETKNNLKKWNVCKIGNPDLYVPFFEIGLSFLNFTGVLGYITINSFFKSVNARLLRKYIHDNQFAFKLINFGEEKVFKGVQAYTCISIIEKEKSSHILYSKVKPITIEKDLSFSMTQIQYSSLDDHSGWHLNSDEALKKIRIIESTGIKLGKKYQIKNGIATLANDVYIFKPLSEDSKYYIHERGGAKYRIEKAICRKILKPNILKSEADIPDSMEQVICPYKQGIEPYSEDELRKGFPCAYKYLQACRETLLKRDKGDTSNYYAWYVFGRNQALSDYGLRLLFPYVADFPRFVFCEDPAIMIYCGYGIFVPNERELLVLKKILESDIFYYYIKNTSKPYSHGFFSYAKNYVKNFGIPELSESQKDLILACEKGQPLTDFLCNIYGISL